jgi:hypothetical protein
VNITKVTPGSQGTVSIDYEIKDKDNSQAVDPENIGFVFVPTTDEDLVVPNISSVQVLGKGFSINQPLIPVQDALADPGQAPTSFETRPIAIGENQAYQILAVGYRCNFGYDNSHHRVSWSNWVNEQNVPKWIVTGDNPDAPLLDLDAIEINQKGNEGLSLGDLGTLVKIRVYNEKLDDIQSLDLTWGDPNAQNTGYNIWGSNGKLAYQSLPQAVSHIAYSNTSSFVLVDANSGSNGFSAIVWLPRSSRQSSDLPEVRLNMVVRKASQSSVAFNAERGAKARANGSVVEFFARLRGIFPFDVLSTDAFLQSGAGLWAQGRLIHKGSDVLQKIALAPWYGSQTSDPNLVNDILNTGIYVTNTQNFKIEDDLEYAFDTQGDAFVDGFTRVDLALSAQDFSLEFVSAYYKFSWPLSLSLYYMAGSPKVLTRINGCELNCPDNSRTEANLSKDIWQSIIDNGLWVKSEESRLGLGNLSTDIVNGRGGTEFETFQSAFDLQVTPYFNSLTSSAPAPGRVNHFIGYLQQKAFLSRPSLGIQHIVSGGDRLHLKFLNGYRAFSSVVLPDLNYSRFRYATTGATTPTADGILPGITEFPINLGFGDYSSDGWLDGIVKSPKTSDISGVQTETPNEFEIKPREGWGPAQVENEFESASPRQTALRFKSPETSDEVIAPLVFYPNRRLYTLFYGGSSLEEKQKNQKLAMLWAAYYAAQKNIYVEVLDAAALNLTNSYPKTGFAQFYSQFLTAAHSWANGKPLFINYKGVNDGVSQMHDHIGYVFNGVDKKGNVYHGVRWIKLQDNGSEDLRFSDDALYPGAFTKIATELVGANYRQHSGAEFVQDVKTPGIGLYHSYSKWSYVTSKVASEVLLNMTISEMFRVAGSVAEASLAKASLRGEVDAYAGINVTTSGGFKNGWTAEKLAALPVGKRPYVYEWATDEMINSHKQYFKDGGVWISPLKYLEGREEIGNFGFPDWPNWTGGTQAGDPGLFMGSIKEYTQLVADANGDWGQMALKLGADPEKWSMNANDLRIAVLNESPYNYGYNLPDGNIIGTNDQFMFGGQTPFKYNEVSGPPIVVKNGNVTWYTPAEFLAKFH